VVTAAAIRWPAVLAVFLLTAGALWGNTTADEDRSRRLSTMFMGPCCWRENLSTHQSPDAAALRQEIRDMVKQGRDDEQIKSSVVAKYTSRILAVPEGPTGRWLSWTPWFAAALGALVVARLLTRVKKQSADAVSPSALPVIDDMDLDP